MINNKEEEIEHIANFFEELYQARDTIEGYETTTEEIKQEVGKALGNTNQTLHPITYCEVKKHIKTLKKNKAMGPDKIPNEAIMSMEEETLNTLTKLFNKILIKGEIPAKWKEGQIIRIYKGKGTKGKTSNERGITLSSNMGKLFEKIINSRIKENIHITDNQGGGKESSSTIDYILTLKETVKRNKLKKKNTYITFLDVTKAYDKAWLDALQISAKNKGATNMDLQMINMVNSNIKATVMTRHGPTRQIQIKDSIRQGGVLSVIQYANMMDEIASNTIQRIPENNQDCTILLWMDDVAIITDNIDKQKQILNNLLDEANKYRVVFGEEKSKIMCIGGKEKDISIKMGNINITQCETYKYLGETVNNKLTLENHINLNKGKAEAAVQTILQVAYDTNFNGIHMSIIWKLIECTIVPILIYGCETWDMSKTDIDKLNTIYLNILKRILLAPKSTPNEGVYHETGLTDIKTIIDQRKLGYYAKIYLSKNKHMITIMNNRNKGSWLSKTEDLMENLGITRINITNKHLWKQKTKEKCQQLFQEKILTGAHNKSKLTGLLTHSNWEKLSRKKYMNHLNRTECHYIFAARTRMLKTKDNYRNQYNDLTCRGCGHQVESQTHILEECTKIHNNEDTKVTRNMIYSEVTNELKKTANKIRKTMEQVDRFNEN